MHLFSPFFLTFLFITTPSKATPAPSPWADTLTKHSWVDVPPGWSYDSSPPADRTFHLHIGLKQAGIDDLVRHLMEVSDPSHPRYGQHLTKEESEELVSSHPDTVDATKSWLASHGIDEPRINHIQAGGDWLTLLVSVAEAERMLGAQYHVYRHDATGERVLRTLSYSLPRDLHSHVDMVAPTTYFSTLHTMRKTSFLQPENIEPIEDVESLVDPVLNAAALPAGCATTVTPSCLRDLYNTTNYKPVSTTKNQLGVAGYLNEYANNADLQTFLKKFRSDAVGFGFPTVQVNNGGNDQSKPGVEANLDIQYTIGMSYPTPNVYYSTGGSPPFIADSTTTENTNEPYLEWITYMLNQTKTPQTVTTSYGDDEQTVPQEYATRVCNMFAQLGARGTTLFFSSGDFGVGGGDCRSNDGTERTMFQPSFPASCPFVTTVGGTTNMNPEVAVNFSGGGFSRYFAQPRYQAGAVSEYLDGLGAQYAGLYNVTGRAYPDVSAQANRFQVVVGGLVVSVGGTSASSPVVASIFSLLNDFRLSRGLRPLGFLNPLLYSLNNTAGYYDGFNDIISGSNPGCGTDGFKAGRGWDPVTGVGTPNFLKLQGLMK